ncbi:hypothetical protein PPERSA_02583 [Pseudocohnilembus persalinus]|uniref:MPN domain-containing protein n=1 Tax=Pseudocohnilembus persalinus TaxID=266149 RepID=A0A0V0R5E8_PSEPJ|nr:hypothetical protein PPERSA_02583 [Pseudocohnilembus persalinus]|eukprot:KRX09711.1 hypothetical protein PPERSA_02583 [Pseudocohnilembus persalinus]
MGECNSTCNKTYDQQYEIQNSRNPEQFSQYNVQDSNNYHLKSKKQIQQEEKNRMNYFSYKNYKNTEFQYNTSQKKQLLNYNDNPYYSLQQDMKNIRKIISEKVSKYGSAMFNNVLYYFDQWNNIIYKDMLKPYEVDIKTYLSSNEQQNCYYLKIAHEVQNFQSFQVLQNFLKQFYLVQFESNLDITSQKDHLNSQISIEFIISDQDFLKLKCQLIRLSEGFEFLEDENFQTKTKKTHHLFYSPEAASKRIQEFHNNQQNNPLIHQNSIKQMSKDQIDQQINAFAQILNMKNLEKCANYILQMHQILTNSKNIEGKQLEELQKLVQSLKMEKKKSKDIFIQENLIQQFINLSDYNTKHKKIETLGYILGFQKNNNFIADQLIVPPQIGKYDSCECTNEEIISNFMENSQRILLAWIHTHPKHVKLNRYIWKKNFQIFQIVQFFSQGQQMSAVDLHNQYLYQVNSQNQNTFLGIIYAPEEKIQLQGYKLNNKGLAELEQCKQVGFHPQHKENYDEIIELYDKEEFLVEDPNLKVQVFDLREDENQFNSSQLQNGQQIQKNQYPDKINANQNKNIQSDKQYNQEQKSQQANLSQNQVQNQAHMKNKIFDNNNLKNQNKDQNINTQTHQFLDTEQGTSQTHFDLISNKINNKQKLQQNLIANNQNNQQNLLRNDLKNF